MGRILRITTANAAQKRQTIKISRKSTRKQTSCTLYARGFPHECTRGSGLDVAYPAANRRTDGCSPSQLQGVVISCRWTATASGALPYVDDGDPAYIDANRDVLELELAVRQTDTARWPEGV